MNAQNSKVYAMTFDFWDIKDGPRPPDSRCAIGCMDGSWWVDWGKLKKMVAASPMPFDFSQTAATVLVMRLLLAARGNIPEVDREMAETIASEYGERRAA